MSTAPRTSGGRSLKGTLTNLASRSMFIAYDGPAYGGGAHVDYTVEKRQMILVKTFLSATYNSPDHFSISNISIVVNGESKGNVSSGSNEKEYIFMGAPGDRISAKIDGVATHSRGTLVSVIYGVD